MEDKNDQVKTEPEVNLTVERVPSERKLKKKKRKARNPVSFDYCSCNLIRSSNYLKSNISRAGTYIL